MQAVDGLALVGGVLRRQAVHRRRAGGEQVGVVVAERAGLGRAAAGARDGCPSRPAGRRPGRRRSSGRRRPPCGPVRAGRAATTVPSVAGRASAGSRAPARWSAAPSSTGTGRSSGSRVRSMGPLKRVYALRYITDGGNMVDHARDGRARGPGPAAAGRAARRRGAQRGAPRGGGRRRVRHQPAGGVPAPAGAARGRRRRLGAAGRRSGCTRSAPRRSTRSSAGRAASAGSGTAGWTRWRRRSPGALVSAAAPGRRGAADDD